MLVVNLYWKESRDKTGPSIIVPSVRARGCINLVIARKEQGTLSSLWGSSFSITACFCSNSQLQSQWKSVVQAAWLMTSAVGSLVVLLWPQSHFLHLMFGVHVFCRCCSQWTNIMLWLCLAVIRTITSAVIGNGFDDIEELIIEEKKRRISMNILIIPSNNDPS
uniref:Uncharacterized protein n=1 Tax=Magallana gigas TaxID=29159 RepID=A0A8W8LAG6_MAGGI